MRTNVVKLGELSENSSREVTQKYILKKLKRDCDFRPSFLGEERNLRSHDIHLGKLKIYIIIPQELSNHLHLFGTADERSETQTGKAKPWYRCHRYGGY